MTRTLLVVKESDTEEQLLCSMVNTHAHSFHVRLCYGLLEARHFLEEYKSTHKTLPDLILIDLDLPEQGGIELLNGIQGLIRECNFMPRVIVIGSRLDEQDTRAAMAFPCVRSVVRKAL